MPKSFEMCLNIKEKASVALGFDVSSCTFPANLTLTTIEDNEVASTIYQFTLGFLIFYFDVRFICKEGEV